MQRTRYCAARPIPSCIALAALASSIGFCAAWSQPAFEAESVTPKTAFVLDADTANEMDDLYAIVHATRDPRADILALTSAHFNNTQITTRRRWHNYDMDGFVPVLASQRENERLAHILNADYPTILGAGDIIGFAWGYSDGDPTPKAPGIDVIIEEARAASVTQKRKIVVLGPLTNIAAAIIQAPDIAERVDIYWLGMRYDVGAGVWNKSEFNARNDLNAVDYLLNRDNVALTIMPASVARQLTFVRGPTEERLARVHHPAAALLLERWDFVGAGEHWIMWDLALTMAVTAPELATVSARPAPPENARAAVNVIIDIDEDAMQARFWSLLQTLNAP